MSFQRVLFLMSISSIALVAAVYVTSRKVAVSSEIGREEQTVPLGLKLEPQILDLGSVMMHREIQFTTQIHNYGQEPINLAKLEKSCGCTSASVTKDTCQPGENVELKGTLYPRKPGRFRHLVKVIEAAQDSPQHVLEVIGEVITSISVTPESVLLSPSVFENKAVEQVIIFKNNSDERAVVREPMGMPEGLSVRIPKGEIGPKQETNVVIRAEPRFFLETNVNLSFPTNHPTQDNVAVTVRLRPENGFSIVPSKIRLGVVSKTELETSPVRLSLIGPGVKDLQVAQIITPPFLRLSKQSTRRVDCMEMEFVFTKTLQGISIQGSIRIDLDVTPRGQTKKGIVTLNVPISGLVHD